MSTPEPALLADVEKRIELENDLGDFAQLVRQNRTFRRFDESDPIEHSLLLELVNIARFCSCGNNLQRLRYHIISGSEERDLMFSQLGWAALLKDWDGPAPGERPTGYIVILSEGKPNPIRAYDAGIAAQTIMLAASQAGYGGCMLRNFRPGLPALLGLDDANLHTELVLALGRPAEKVVLEKVSEPHGLTYWRDDDGVHHVPKLALDDVLV